MLEVTRVTTRIPSILGWCGLHCAAGGCCQPESQNPTTNALNKLGHEYSERSGLEDESLINLGLMKVAVTRRGYHQNRAARVFRVKRTPLFILFAYLEEHLHTFVYSMPLLHAGFQFTSLELMQGRSTPEISLVRPPLPPHYHAMASPALPM